MPTKILVLGDGAAGTIISNKLRYLIRKENAEITVIGNSKYHYFKPDGIHIPLGMKDYQTSVKKPDYLFNYGIDYIKDTVTKIDVENRKVDVSSGREYTYDYLIIATGDRLVTDEFQNFDSEAHHFYSLEASLELGKELSKFNGGKIVVGPSSIPYQCPPAPYEFTFQLDRYLRRRGIRDKTELHYTFPLNRVFTMENVSERVQDLFDEKDIEYHTMFNLESIDADSKKLVSLEGDELDYDLLILVPPHKGQQVITDSGLADEQGYIDVDRHKLSYGNYDNVFVIGDATNLPISKAGATAHFESEYLAGKIASEVSGFVSEEFYDGSVACTTVTGDERAFTLYFSYERPPRAMYQSKLDFLLKWTSADTYFSAMLRGVM
ncbi:N-acyl homoserine lactone synthase [uncultured archaeon]|nr:N-acyl homoserine lactone synthase [uncultured archaeon]HKJ96314.1 FAD/NAD(P)-binding oxidoreductase [Thermoplasmataceae archaeon]